MNHLVYAFRFLRNAWYLDKIYQHSHERENETELCKNNRDQQNRKMKEIYDRQTEEIINGLSVSGIAPLCFNDVLSSLKSMIS